MYHLLSTVKTFLEAHRTHSNNLHFRGKLVIIKQIESEGSRQDTPILPTHGIGHLRFLQQISTFLIHISNRTD